MAESYECTICGADTTRGSLVLTKGEWLAVPLCSDHKYSIADALPEGTHIIDSTRRN